MTGPSGDSRTRRRVGWWGRLTAALSGGHAAAITTAVGWVSLLLVGHLIWENFQLERCRDTYNEDASAALKARTAAAAEDRRLLDQERRVDTSDREQDRRDDAALSALLFSLLDRSTTPEATAEKRAIFLNLVRVRRETAKQRAANDTDRDRLARERAMVEQARQRSPLPEPPTQSC